MSNKIINKKTKILQIFFCLFILDSITCQSHNHSLERIAVDFQNLVNTYKVKENVINLSPTTLITIQNLTCFFLFDSNQTNPVAKSIKYINPNLTFTFNVVLTKKVPNKTAKEQTIIIEKVVGYLNYESITLYKQGDNSFDFERPKDYKEGFIDLNPFTPYEIFNETVEYLEKEGKEMLVNAWYNIFTQILVIYPICDSYRNYIDLKKYLTSDKYFIITNPEAPDLKRIKFINIEYNSISKNYISSVTVHFLKLEIDYNWITDFRTNVLFNYVNITKSQIQFGEFFPNNQTLENAIKGIMTDALVYLLNFKQ